MAAETLAKFEKSDKKRNRLISKRVISIDAYTQHLPLLGELNNNPPDITLDRKQVLPS